MHVPLIINSLMWPAAGVAINTPNHLAFYLFALQQLAFPASLTGLFATESASDDSPVLIKLQVSVYGNI